MFPASAGQVWELLLSPEALEACIPGCETLKLVDEHTYEATVKVGVGPVRGAFKGRVRLTDQQEPTQYRLLVEGSGGPGHVSGSAEVHLVQVEDGTEVSVVGEGQIRGTIAGIGQRMVTGVARMQMNQFFECMRKRVELTAGGQTHR
jgi:carbon monoxide dehydrogenase subunit G